MSCLHAYLQNHMTDFRQMFVHVASDRDSFLFWWHCNMLCSSIFVHSDTSSSSSRNRAISDAEQYRTARFPWWGRLTHFNIGAESDVYDCLVVTVVILLCMWTSWSNQWALTQDYHELGLSTAWFKWVIWNIQELCNNACDGWNSDKHVLAFMLSTLWFCRC